MISFIQYITEGGRFFTDIHTNKIFHGTSDKFLSSILKTGLLTNKEGKLYIDTDQHIASREAHDTVYGGGILNKSEARGGLPIVICIKLNPKDNHKWYMDPDYHGKNGVEGEKSIWHPHAFITNSKIPTKNIIGWLDYKQIFHKT